jgi:hypothetical protein
MKAERAHRDIRRREHTQTQTHTHTHTHTHTQTDSLSALQGHLTMPK